MKTLDNFKIVLKDGSTYDMADDFNVLVRSFSITSPQPVPIHEKIDGGNGLIRMGRELNPPKISVAGSFFAADYTDTELLRAELVRLLLTTEEFYVIHDAQPYKRWLVELGSEFSPGKIGSYGEFTIDFVMASAYAESVGTTIDPFTFDSELWGVGNGLTADEDHTYINTTTAFRIFNAGDVTINPRELPLKITFTGASTDLKITNTTTGETWSYTGTTTTGQSLSIDGVRSLKNGVSVFADTNRKLITLKPGWNDFTVTGATYPFTVTFEFRFYYL